MKVLIYCYFRFSSIVFVLQRISTRLNLSLCVRIDNKFLVIIIKYNITNIQTPRLVPSHFDIFHNIAISIIQMIIGPIVVHVAIKNLFVACFSVIILPSKFKNLSHRCFCIIVCPLVDQACIV